MTAMWIVVAYFAVGIVLRFLTKEGPEDDGGFWFVLFWPVFVTLFALRRG